jgi:hypothetical protein
MLRSKSFGQIVQVVHLISRLQAAATRSANVELFIIVGFKLFLGTYIQDQPDIG